MRGDLVETYKILTRLDRVDSERMFPMVGESRTRGYSLRIRGKPFRTEVRRNFFTLNKLIIALGAKGIKGYGGKGDQDIELDDQP